MNDTLAYLASFARFPRALRAFLARPLTIEGARAIVAARFAHRESNFLRIVERSIYKHPASPYLKLLRHAGCELGDLKTLVATRGLDGALDALRDAGVYVTFEEFKGRTPIVRGNLSIVASARDFDNPYARRDVTMTTGGTSGVATAVNHDLDHIASTAAVAMLMFDAWQVLDSPAVFWHHILPGPGVRFVLQRAHHGNPPAAALYGYAAEFPDVQIEGLHVRREWAAQHAAALRDFLRAQLVAYRRVIDQPQVLFDESVTRLKIDADTAKAIGTSHLEMHIWDANGLLTTDNIQSTIDFLVKAHVLPDGTRSSQVADFPYLNAVLDDIGRVH